MKKKIALCIFLAILSVIPANAAKYFVLDINNIFDSVTFNGVNVKEIERQINYGDKSGFLIKTLTFANSDIEKVYYNISENRNYQIYLPYDAKAARIEVYNTRNSKIMDIDVSSFANTCGNNACEEHESYESCTKDCKSGSKDDFCDSLADGTCDPDCSPKTDTDCSQVSYKGANENLTKTSAGSVVNPNKSPKIPKERKTSLIYFILMPITLVLVVGGLVFIAIKRKRENQIASSLKQYIIENIKRGFTLQQIKDVLYREGYSEREIDKAVKTI
ncbi:hypothetical protein HYY70_03270 [Candidatus Woesearchaeota archaeon]|nr:hypothetical protein [Candidatus Woesearchaeota archaeon]